jgi:hypothetical protein
MGSRGRIGGACQEQTPVADGAQMVDDEAKQLLLDAATLVSGKQRENDHFAGGVVSEAVPDHRRTVDADIAGEGTGPTSSAQDCSVIPIAASLSAEIAYSRVCPRSTMQTAMSSGVARRLFMSSRAVAPSGTSTWWHEPRTQASDAFGRMAARRTG